MMQASNVKPRLSLGPVLYYWSRDRLIEFYARMADTPVDIVYLGETVCSKRRAMRMDDWIELADRLDNAGKEVVLSTLTLIEAGSESGAMQRLCENPRYCVEANDIGAVNLLAGRQPFITGPSVNIYNQHTLRVLADQGLKRWVFPLELSRDTLADMQRLRPDGVETEVFVYGRLPLAYSARCFTARAHNLPKDDCQFRCLDYPDGLQLQTRENEEFLVLNGIQTQSMKVCNLITETGDAVGLGVDILRISPQYEHTEDVIRIFDRRLRGELTNSAAEAALEGLATGEYCNGYWHGEPGMDACLKREVTCP